VSLDTEQRGAGGTARWHLLFVLQQGARITPQNCHSMMCCLAENSGSTGGDTNIRRQHPQGSWCTLLSHHWSCSSSVQ
jgi:hypothetical protein